MESTNSKIQDINIYYRESSNYLALKDHFHYNHELILVTEGNSKFDISGKEYLVSSNSLVFISNLEQHEIVALCGSAYKRYVLLLSHAYCLLAVREPSLLSILLHRPDNFSHVIAIDAELANKTKSYFSLILKEFTERKIFWNTRCAVLLTDMLLTIYREKGDVFPTHENHETVNAIINIQKHIANNLGDTITLDMLAKQYYIGKYHLSRMFKDITGYGFKEYMTLCRLNEAKKLLCDTKISITNVCQATGYRDVNHFIRNFRNHEGLTPLQYRKKCLKQ